MNKSGNMRNPCNKRHTNNFLSSEQQHKKVCTSVCISFIHKLLANIFYDKPLALNLSSEKVG